MANIPKTHIYKITRNGVVLGNLPNVKSMFNFSWDINTPGTRIVIDVGISADTSALPSGQLYTEAGDPLTTEAGENLYTERAEDVVGSQNSNILLSNGNTVTVIEISNYYPNGKVMFVGTIDRWEAKFGDPSESDIVRVTAYSKSQDLDNYLIQV